MHPPPFALHPPSFALHPALFALHPPPFTLHPPPFALHPPPFSSSSIKGRTLKSLHTFVQYTEAANAPLCLFCSCVSFWSQCRSWCLAIKRMRWAPGTVSRQRCSRSGRGWLPRRVREVDPSWLVLLGMHGVCMQEGGSSVTGEKRPSICVSRCQHLLLVFVTSVTVIAYLVT